MPWTGFEFKKRHWQDATPHEAYRAAEMASAMIANGTPEGVAIATAIKKVKEGRPKPNPARAIKRAKVKGRSDATKSPPSRPVERTANGL